MAQDIKPNGSEVLIFRHIEGKKPYEQNDEEYIKGRILSSDWSSSWMMYTVLGEDGNTYYGNYGRRIIGDSYFLTREDYIRYLESKIEKIEEEKEMLEETKNKYLKMIEAVKPWKFSKNRKY